MLPILHKVLKGWTRVSQSNAAWSGSNATPDVSGEKLAGLLPAEPAQNTIYHWWVQ